MQPKRVLKFEGAFQILVFASLFLAAGRVYAQNDDIPFDTNVTPPTQKTSTQGRPGSTQIQSGQLPNQNPPAGPTDDSNYTPTPQEVAPPPELEMQQAPLPKAIIVPTPGKGEMPRRKLGPAELAGLNRLAPFDDIAVISRRYLPKTKRFEFFPNLGVVLNDAFFTDIILGARLGYHFSEQYSVEASGITFSTTNKQVTNELSIQRGVGTTSLATPTSFYGLDFKWTPIYGKIAWLDKSIVPFDFYFSAGGGVTGTNQGTNPPTVHIGAGQLFALNKWLAFRWDVSWYAYQSSTTVTGNPNGTFTNLHATIGVSIFFPSAGYR